jgi:hypothetical protein
MSTTRRPTKAQALAGVQALIAGTQKHFPNGTFTIGNAAFTTASLVGLLQSLEDAMTKQNASSAAARDALAALRERESQVGPVIQDFRTILVAQFGDASQTLADFGLAPRKAHTPLTVEQKAEVNAKREATRKARGTKGPKAKLAIKGTVTAPAATPPAPAPASATPAAPSAPIASPAKPAS